MPRYPERSVSESWERWRQRVTERRLGIRRANRSRVTDAWSELAWGTVTSRKGSARGTCAAFPGCPKAGVSQG